jgi:DNA invertase Pin-like site-specific DNA recombinase
MVCNCGIFSRVVVEIMKETLHTSTRVSTAAQEEAASSDTQKNIGIIESKELGMAHKVWNEGVASFHHENLLNRPVLPQLLGEIESGSIKHLFVI